MGTREGWRRYAADLGVPLGTAVLVLVGSVIAPQVPVALDGWGYLLLLIGSAATAARHRIPVAVLLLTSACLIVYQVRGYPGLPVAVPVLVAIYSAVSAGHRLVAGGAVLAIAAGLLIGDFVVARGHPSLDLVQRQDLLIGWVVAAGVMAEVSRQRRAYLTQVEQRAVEAERTREETARRRAGEERLRIARELHDSLTHSISVIKVQAGVAIHLARKREEEVPPALLAIFQASADAMRELRATLEVLRRDEDDPAAGNGLGDLDALVDRARSAGLPVTVTVAGRPRPLPSPVDRAAYRIVQEALTNVTKHAGPATTSVHLEYGERGLAVRVEDDGSAGGIDGFGSGGAAGQQVPAGQRPEPAGEPDGALDRPGRRAVGVGLVGMRERVTALGGTLLAGPRSGRGFRVLAELPLEEPR